MSLVGFSARNHPQQAVRDIVDDRRTPAWLFAPLHERHRFTLDAAASAENALLPKFYDRESDGLLRSWSGERVWCNPPYSRLEGWLAKAWQEMESGCELVVMLLPANRTEQKFWQEYVEPFRDGGGAACYAPLHHVRAPSRAIRVPAGSEELPGAEVRQRPPHVGAAGVKISTTFLAQRIRFGWPEARVTPKKGDRPPFGLVLLTFAR